MLQWLKDFTHREKLVIQGREIIIIDRSNAPISVERAIRSGILMACSKSREATFFPRLEFVLVIIPTARNAEKSSTNAWVNSKERFSSLFNMSVDMKNVCA